MISHLKEPVNLTNFKHLATIFVVLFIALTIPLTVFLTQKSEEVNKTPQAATTRDPALWPFDKLSPWNMPIGSGASYVDAQINMSGKWQDVEGELVFLDDSAPLKTLYANYGDWWPGVACNTGLKDQGQIHVEDNYLVPAPTNGGEDGNLPNRAGGGLRSDNKTIQEFQYSTRCDATGPVTAGAIRTTYDIYGKGIPTNGSTSLPEGYGAHGGSGLSGVGGALRKWEVNDTGPIRHALKMTVNVGVLSKCNGGYRWPAIVADSGYSVVGGDNEYFGPVCDFRMGSLTAMHPSVTCQTFATTALGKRICQALQDYGAYIVDTGPRSWGAMVILGEYGTASAMNGAGADIEKMFDNLYVIANNSSTNVGGGGTPRVALAPDFGAAVDNPPTVSITNPANGALINTSSVNVSANASDDTGVSKVEFYVDGALKSPADTTVPYSYPWTTTGLTGSHTISAKAYDSANQASNLQTVTVNVDLTAAAPPAPWVSTDIGAVGIGGSAIYSTSTGTFTVTGSGDDIWNAADAFRYVYQPLNGDGTIVAKVNSQTNTDPWAKAGVMIRETTAAGSINALLTSTTGSGLDLQYRSTTNGTGTYINGGAFTYPVWLKLQRTGNNISAFKSSDGVSFTQVGTILSLPMAANVTIGLAVTSHNNTLSSSATFNNVSVSTGLSDTTAPTVNITSPVNSASVSGAVTIAASATDNAAVAKVDFYIDGTFKGSDNTSPYSYLWDSTAVSNGTHQLAAKAYDAAGNMGMSSIAVTVVNGDTQAPTTPTALQATPTSSSQVTLNWAASTDNVGVVGYWIVRGGVTLASTSLTSFEDLTVSPSTSYSYQVVAFDAAGNNSAASNTALTTTPASPDTQVPTVPSNLTATAVSSSQINLSWTAAADNIGVTGYEIWRNSVRVATIGNFTSFGDTGLSASTTYSYFVKAKDAAGNVSAGSNLASAATQAPPATTGTITGTVSSSAGGVLSGAKVSTVVSGSKRTVTTNSSGVYNFTSLPANSYSLRYSAWRHTSQNQTVSVSAGVTVTKNVTLQRR